MQSIQQVSVWAKAMRLLVIAMCLGMVYSTAALAEYSYIKDEANVLSDTIKQRLNKLLSSLEEQKNIRIEEVILPTIGSKDPLQVVGDLARQLDANPTNAENRVLIVYVLDSGFIQIYPNAKLATILNQENIDNVIKNASTPMKEKNYDEMARIGVAGVYHHYQKHQPVDKAASEKKTKKTMFNILIALGLLGVVVALIKLTSKKSL
ncbi:MAG: YgcG family protein [Candidatus Berkiella sp.]